MLYNFFNVIAKNPDWKVADIKGADGSQYQNVSINRTNTKGEVFPRFDDVANGAQIEGEYWQSGAGKNYLFGPRTPKTRSQGSSGAITKAQDRKKADITEAQGNKEYSVKVASTARDATMITVELMKQDPLGQWHTIWEDTRERLWKMYDREKEPF